MIRANDLILGQGAYYEMDGYKTKVNNNVLVVGTSGCGKTRNIVTPNLAQAVGSYIVSDPKGNLYEQYSEMLKNKGYIVKKVDFTRPETSVKYNPLAYIHSEQDILKLANMINNFSDAITNDPFWDQAAELLLTALIGFTTICQPKDRNLNTIQRLVEQGQMTEDCNEKSVLDQIFIKLEKEDANCFPVRQYKKFRVGADRTVKCIIQTLAAKIGAFDTKEVRQFLAKDEVNFATIGQEKTAVFVVISDTDRSMDVLANLFFTQAMNELCKYADEECGDRNNRLPVDVRFILDDFATNVTISEFPRMIASIRSRGISTMLLIQAEAQLKTRYKEDYLTIIGNCDTYVYLGGNDIATAKSVAERCDIRTNKILNMKVGESWIFRRGQAPINGTLFNMDTYETEKETEKEIEKATVKATEREVKVKDSSIHCGEER